MRLETNITAIAAAQSKRNEHQTLADGALAGERRVAAARIVMAGMLSFLTDAPRLIGHEPATPLQSVVGVAYVVAALTIYLVLRTTRAEPHLSSLRAPLMTVLDFGFVSALAILDHGEDGLAMHPIACAILIAFTVARYNLWHVAFAVVCAEGSYVVVRLYACAFDPHPAAFAIGVYAVLGVVVALTNRAVRTMFRDLRRRDNLTRFLPDQVVERLLHAGTEALAPIQREVTILFSDIRGFTAMSESLEPRAVLALLDDYFGQMTQVVRGHDGVVGKFIGDGMLAFWGVPDRVDNHAVRAVRAARDMRRVLRELNEHRARIGDAPLRIGVGVHTGVVAAGLLGGTQAEYTIIGDAVNVASRIEGLTKDYAVDLLISATTWAQLGAQPRGRHLASASIRGRREPVELYTIDPDDPDPATVAAG
jgi:adenylate cyclase